MFNQPLLKPSHSGVTRTCVARHDGEAGVPACNQ